MGTPLDRAIQQKAAIVPIDSAEARSMCRFSPLHRHKASEFFLHDIHVRVYIHACVCTDMHIDKERNRQVEIGNAEHCRLRR